jgi:ParB family chromosome partitioning protein
LYLAVEISRATDESIQDSLTEALLNGTIKGKHINIIKRIIDNRKNGNKGSTNKMFTTRRFQKKYSPEELAVMYQKNSDEHKEIQAKARYSRETLRLVKEIFRQLTQDNHFCELLSKNNITDMPEILSPAR